MALGDSIKQALNTVKYPFYDQVRTLNPKQNYQFLLLYRLPDYLITPNKENKFQFFSTQDQKVFLEYYNKIENTAAKIDNKEILPNVTGKLLSLATRTAPKIQYNTAKLNEKILNQNINIAAGIEYPTNFSITFREYEFYPIYRIIRSWALMASNVYTKVTSKKSDFVGQIYRIEFKADFNMNNVVNNPEGKIDSTIFDSYSDGIERVVVYDGVYPTNIPDDVTFSNENFDLIKYDINFNFERVYDNTDLTNFDLLEINNIFKLLLNETNSKSIL